MDKSMRRPRAARTKGDRRAEQSDVSAGAASPLSPEERDALVAAARSADERARCAEAGLLAAARELATARELAAAAAYDAVDTSASDAEAPLDEQAEFDAELANWREGGLRPPLPPGGEEAEELVARAAAVLNPADRITGLWDLFMRLERLESPAARARARARCVPSDSARAPQPWVRTATLWKRASRLKERADELAAIAAERRNAGEEADAKDLDDQAARIRSEGDTREIEALLCDAYDEANEVAADDSSWARSARRKTWFLPVARTLYDADWSRPKIAELIVNADRHWWRDPCPNVAAERRVVRDHVGDARQDCEALGEVLRKDMKESAPPATRVTRHRGGKVGARRRRGS